MIVEYKLHRDNSNSLIKPYFIKFGGMFKINNTFIGFPYIDDETFIPKTLKEITEDELKARILKLDYKNPTTNISLNEQERTDMFDQFMKNKE